MEEVRRQVAEEQAAQAALILKEGDDAQIISG